MAIQLRKCRLCEKQAELRQSHIIPDFFLRGGEDYYPTGTSGALQPFTQPVSTIPGKTFERKQKGHYERKLGQVEYLLCGDCEQLLCEYESYVKTFFYGLSSPIRLVLPISNDPFFTADYRKVKLFQLSILWRASVANGDFFSNVRLKPRHEEEVRKMLLKGDPGKEDRFLCGMGRLVVKTPEMKDLLDKHNYAVERFVGAPIVHHFPKCTLVTFLMGGLGWSFCVSDSGYLPVMKDTFIKENGVFFLSSMNADEFFIEFSTKTVVAGNVTHEVVLANRKAKQRTG